MAIKGGQIIHAGNGTTVIDRIQSGGPGQVNIPTEKIYELGNYKSVATVRDTPDLTFPLESFDVSTEIEALLTKSYEGRTVGVAHDGTDVVTIATGDPFTQADVGRVLIVDFGTLAPNKVVQIQSVDNATGDATVTEPVGGAQFGTQATARVVANGIDLSRSLPVDIASQFKAGKDQADPFSVVASVAVPFLYLEQMSYRFGLRDNATQSAQLRGDTIFYNPGASFVQAAAGTGAAGQTIVTENPAFAVAEGDARRVLSVTAGTTRLAFGADYTETYGAEADGAAVTTVTLTDAVPTGTEVRIMYSSPADVEYPEAVHPDVLVKPGAVRGRDIEIYVGGYDPADVAGSQTNKLGSVQSVQVDWRVQLDKDEEFGNYYAVGQDFEVPTVNGSVDIKPRNPADLLALIRKVQGVIDDRAVLGTASSVPLPLDVVIKHPETGATLKRLHVPDARFTPPGIAGRVQQKTTVTLPYESDEGTLLIFEA